MPKNANTPNDLTLALKEVAAKFIGNFPRACDASRSNLGYKYSFRKTSRSAISDFGSVVGLIVETRPRAIGFSEAICQVNKILKIPILILHGPKNFEDVRSVCEELEDGCYESHELSPNILTLDGYNRLLMSESLYDLFGNAIQLLVFQSDSLPCINSEYTLSDFEKFDYVGGEWPPNRPSGLYCLGGNGGFSLRSIKLSVLCLKLFEGVKWSKGEDGFFSFFIDVLGGKVADRAEQARFCSQSNKLNIGTFAIHKFVIPEDPRQRLILQQACPLWLDRGKTGSFDDNFQKNLVVNYLSASAQDVSSAADSSLGIVSVDLGCGDRPLNPFKSAHPFGIDCRAVSKSNFTIYKSDLALDPLPFDDGSVDFVSAIGLLEHIPRVIYLPHRRLPFIELFNEISRILRPGGIFYLRTLCCPHPAAFSDPTHVNFLTPDTFKIYFDIGDNSKAAGFMYGYTGTLFQECQFRFNQRHLSVFFRKKEFGDSGVKASVLEDVSPWRNIAELAEFVSRTTRRPVSANDIIFF